jgi:hypothetical protein
MGRLMVLSGFSSGKIFVISFHTSSGRDVIVLTYFFLFLNIIKYDKKLMSYIPIYFSVGSKQMLIGLIIND